MELLSSFLPEAFSTDIIFAWKRIEENTDVAFLTSSEMEISRSFKNSARQKEHISSRRLIRQMVERQGHDAEMFTLKKDDLGKPYGHINGKNINMSIAHTDDRVLCAMSARIAVGVDMEPASRKSIPQLRARILNTDEEDLLADETTMRIWTVKEALVKLMGTGMRTNLNQLIIESKNGDEFIAQCDNDNRAKVCSFVHDKNWLAVATYVDKK